MPSTATASTKTTDQAAVKQQLGQQLPKHMAKKALVCFFFSFSFSFSIAQFFVCVFTYLLFIWGCRWCCCSRCFCQQQKNRNCKLRQQCNRNWRCWESEGAGVEGENWLLAGKAGRWWKQCYKLKSSSSMIRNLLCWIINCAFGLGCGRKYHYFFRWKWKYCKLMMHWEMVESKSNHYITLNIYNNISMLNLSH